MPRRKAVPALGRLCLQSLAQHMESLWVRDYSERYLDEYQFRFVIGPFDGLAGSLVQELLVLLGESRRLTRAALHLLLLPHLRQVSLAACPGLVSNDIGRLLALRCTSLRCLDLQGCSRLSPPVLVDVVESLPGLVRLGLAATQAEVTVLAAVGSCCPRLQELDVSRCKKATPRALRFLAFDPLERRRCGSALRVLLARGLQDDHDDAAVAAAAFLLLALPCLEELAHAATPRALCRLHRGRLDGDHRDDNEGFPTLRELARQRGLETEGTQLVLHHAEGMDQVAMGAVSPRVELEGTQLTLRHVEGMEEAAVGAMSPRMESGGHQLALRHVEEAAVGAMSPPMEPEGTQLALHHAEGMKEASLVATGGHQLTLRRVEGVKDVEEVAVGAMSSRMDPEGTQLALRRVEDVEESSLAAVGAVCPRVESLSAWLGEEGAGVVGHELLRWQRLERLVLGCAEPRPLAELVPLARGLGGRLHSLTLHGFVCRDPLALPGLLAACPALEDFTAELHGPARAEEDTEDDEEPPRWAADLLPALPWLHTFSLALSGCVPARHRPTLGSTLASLLCRAPRLRTLRLLAVPVELDSVLETALAAPEPLRELRELALAESRVSARAVWLLLATHGPLRRLDLSRCRQVLRRDYDAFLHTVRRQRLDLDIIWQ